MLLNDFFYINNLIADGFEANADLEINAGHKIFEGHFPGQPVVPGVCMMQLIKEILEQVIGKKINIVNASEMKFLSIINPLENNIIQCSIKYSSQEDGDLVVLATLYKKELTYFKFKGVFNFRHMGL